jgi:hypothetical protein
MSCASLWSASARDQRHFWNDDAHTLAAWCHTWNIFVKQHGMQKGNSLVWEQTTRGAVEHSFSASMAMAAIKGQKP